jgi:hypothetical protein
MGIAGLRVAMTQLTASTHDYINTFTCTWPWAAWPGRHQRTRHMATSSSILWRCKTNARGLDSNFAPNHDDNMAFRRL